MFLINVAWTLVFLAAFSLVLLRRHPLSVGLLGGSYLLAFAAGLVAMPALMSIALLLAAAYAVAPERGRRWRVTGHALFVLVAIVLGLHLFPGFENPRVIGPVRYTADALPFTMHVNLDKPLAGWWVLFAWPALCLHRGRWSWALGVL